jgi:hypothetical protein
MFGKLFSRKSKSKSKVLPIKEKSLCAWGVTITIKQPKNSNNSTRKNNTKTKKNRNSGLSQEKVEEFVSDIRDYLHTEGRQEQFDKETEWNPKESTLYFVFVSDEYKTSADVKEDLCDIDMKGNTNSTIEYFHSKDKMHVEKL